MKNIILLTLVTIILSNRILQSVPSGDNIKGIFQIDRPISQDKAGENDFGDPGDETDEPIRVCFSYDSEFWNDHSNWRIQDQNVLDMIRLFTQGSAQVMRNILSVKRPQKDPMYFYPNDSPIYEQLDKAIDIPQSHIDGNKFYLELDGVNNCDLMIWVGLYIEKSYSFAQSINVQVSRTTNRPQFAVMWFNFDLGLDPYLNNFEYTQKLFLQIVLQCAGFSYSLYPYFQNNPIQNENNRTYIVSPLALKAAQEHFGCDDIQKLPLEDDGGTGVRSQRWDQTFLYNDLLSNALLGSNHVLTKISLSVFEDSGWYKPNYSFAEDTFWGKDQGCNFLKCDSDGKDTKFWEFCTEIGKFGIEPFFSGLGTCGTKDFLECPVNVRKYADCVAPELAGLDALLPTYQSVSRTSVAFLSTFNTDSSFVSTETEFRCFDYSITSTGSMKIQVGENEVECTKEEEFTLKTISGIYGNLECPTKRLWDFERNDCFGDCGRLGYCHAGECICYKGSYKDTQGRCRCQDTDKENCLHLYGNVKYVTDWDNDDEYQGGYGTEDEKSSTSNGTDDAGYDDGDAGYDGYDSDDDDDDDDDDVDDDDEVDDVDDNDEQQVSTPNGSSLLVILTVLWVL